MNFVVRLTNVDLRFKMDEVLGIKFQNFLKKLKNFKIKRAILVIFYSYFCQKLKNDYLRE